MSKSLQLTFTREDRHGRFEVTARATFQPTPVTPANQADWQRIYDVLTTPSVARTAPCPTTQRFSRPPACSTAR